MTLDTLTVCGDCLSWIAYGDDSQLDLLPTGIAAAHREYRDKLIEWQTRDGARLVPNCGDDCESFTTVPCATCGSRGYTAHSVAVVVR